MKKFTINEFRATYPDNDACLDRIYQLRYNGLVCPKCEGTKPFTRVKDRRSYQCPSCGFQQPNTGNDLRKDYHTPYALVLCHLLADYHQERSSR